jgi:hypothetical protein
MSVTGDIQGFRDNFDKLANEPKILLALPHCWLRQNRSVTAVDRATVTASASAE